MAAMIDERILQLTRELLCKVAVLEQQTAELRRGMCPTVIGENKKEFNHEADHLLLFDDIDAGCL